VSPEAPNERRQTVALWFVYFLELANDDICVGSTNDLKGRAIEAGEGCKVDEIVVKSEFSL
jgi:hypothetical protein